MTVKHSKLTCCFVSFVPTPFFSAVKTIVKSYFCIMAPPTIYRSLDSVLSVLRNYEGDDKESVASLLQVYDNSAKRYENEFDKEALKHPLIVLEGLDGCGKSTTGKRLAKKLGGRSWSTPPESIKYIRSLFDERPTLRPAYYALGNYIAALEVALVLKQQPVVMDRYWYSTSIYAMAHAVHNYPGELAMPPSGDPFYDWPSDLMKPDKVLFLGLAEKVRIERLSRRTVWTVQEKLLRDSESFRNNIVLGYKNMVDPPVTFINSNLGFGPVLREIDSKIGHLF